MSESAAQAGTAPQQAPAHRPDVPDEATVKEFTWSAVLLGSVLGIVFGASSLYLVLKVGMTVSASIPVACIMLAGALLSYFVLVPAMYFFGEGMDEALYPGVVPIRDMTPEQMRSAYILYIGAGAVATGGIISLCRAMPLILASIAVGLRGRLQRRHDYFSDEIPALLGAAGDRLGTAETNAPALAAFALLVLVLLLVGLGRWRTGER